MSDFSDETAAEALDVIAEFGEICTFTRKVKGDYSTVNLTHASSTTVTYYVYGFPYEFKTAEINQVTVIQTDKKLLIPVTDTSGASFEPLVGDYVTIGSTKYRVKDILNPVRVNGANVIFILQIGV